MQAFFDDSGKESQNTNGFVVIAGYIGTSAIWYPFAEAWHHLLLKHELREVHLRSWLTVCQERRWDHTKGNAVLLEFADLVRQADYLIGVGVAVDATVWRALSPARRTQFGTAQEFCFQRILRRVIERLDNSSNRELIEVVFDRDFEFASSRMKLLDHINKKHPEIKDRIVQISFASAAFYCQLQAADLLAWETRKFLVNQTEGKQPTGRLRVLLEAIPDRPLNYAHEFWGQAEVDRYFREVEVPSASSGKSQP
jgi:hypothetical protein